MKKAWIKLSFLGKIGFIFMSLGFVTMSLFIYSPIFPIGTWITGVGMGIFCSDVSK